MEWKTVKLGDCLSKIIDNRGKTPKDLAASGHPLLEINAVSKNNKYPLYGEAKKYVDDVVYSTWFRSGHPQYGDILVPTVGTLGAVAYVDRNDCCIAQNLIALRANADICDSAYIYYLLCNPQIVKRLLNLDIGAVQASIKVPHLLALEILLPSLETQRRIATILSSLDDKIENNNRINRNLEEQVQALFKSWFVDFEPWGGTMPEDWKEGTIADLVDLLNGFAFKSSDFVANGIYNLITIKGVQDGKMTTDSADHLDVIPAKMPNWCLLQKGDILLSLTGNVGRCCLVDIENCLLNQRVAKLQPKTEYNRLYVYTLFRQEEMKARMISISRGTAQMNLSPIETGKLSIIIPTDKVLADFGMRYNGILDTILNNISESARLAALRDTLLPKLMRGEITL